MDFNSTIDLIIKELDEARDIIDDLKRYPGVPVLQVELAKSKCKSAGEVIALLKNLRGDNAPFAEEEHIHQPEKPAEEKTVPSIPVSETPVPGEKKLKEEEAIASFINPSPEAKNIVTITAEIIPPVKEEFENQPEKVTEPAIIADKFNNLPNSLNEQLGSMKNDSDLSDILTIKPLSTLSEAIGINDKFLFIREIFHDNKDTYTQAILRLESAENMEDARGVIMSYAGEKNENEAIKQLLGLVKRKLLSNG
ncbi:MAG: hypothetical protein LLG13_00290 [Bacteroidales bacterium]|nr:hypothetical protein [Bacteroidales bacterium]